MNFPCQILPFSLTLEREEEKILLFLLFPLKSDHFYEFRRIR